MLHDRKHIVTNYLTSCTKTLSFMAKDLAFNVFTPSGLERKISTNYSPTPLKELNT